MPRLLRSSPGANALVPGVQVAYDQIQRLLSCVKPLIGTLCVRTAVRRQLPTKRASGHCGCASRQPTCGLLHAWGHLCRPG